MLVKKAKLQINRCFIFLVKQQVIFVRELVEKNSITLSCCVCWGFILLQQIHFYFNLAGNTP